MAKVTRSTAQVIASHEALQICKSVISFIYEVRSDDRKCVV